MGHQPLQADPGAAARGRGFLTYEDRAWPKPAACRAFWRRATHPAHPVHGQRRRGPRSLPVVPRPPGTCEPNGTRCDKWRISRSFRFIWHHVWKAGTTSLSPYLSCNFDALPVASLLRQLGGPVPGYLHVGTAREPLSRFVSGYQEVYFRDLAGSGSRCNHRQVPWLRVALDYAEGGTQSHAPRAAGDAGRPKCPIGALGADGALRVLEQFVSDVSCGVRFGNGEHLMSQVHCVGVPGMGDAPVWVGG